MPIKPQNCPESGLSLTALIEQKKHLTFLHHMAPACIRPFQNSKPFVGMHQCLTDTEKALVSELPQRKMAAEVENVIRMRGNSWDLNRHSYWKLNRYIWHFWDALWGVDWLLFLFYYLFYGLSLLLGLFKSETYFGLYAHMTLKHRFPCGHWN